MKKLILLFVLWLAFSYLQAQPWLSYLPNGKSPGDWTFFDYQKAFDEYCKSNNIDFSNLQLNEAEGEQHNVVVHFKRWEYSWKYFVNPLTGEFPSVTPFMAFQNYLKKYGNIKNEGNWTCLGTDNSLGGYAGIGRINTIAFHPDNNNTFWIGAPAGGLWVTTDAGNAWTCLTDSNAVLGVSAIAIPSDYATSGIIYIGTGDRDASSNYSVGVLKSEDGGLTWHTTGLSFSPSQKKILNDLLINPENDSILYAAVSDGFYVSYDAAQTWTKTSNNSFIDLEFCPGSPDTIYASTRNSFIYRSTDGGHSFDMIFNTNSNGRVELAVTPDSPAVVYALAAGGDNGLYGIFKSSDYGESFSLIYNEKNLLHWNANGSGTGGQGWYDLALAADPNNANVLYCGGVNTWKSEDGGYNWTLVSHWSGDGGVQAVHADKHCLKFRKNSSVIFETNDGGVYYSDDGGNSWNDISNGLVISQIYKLSTAQTFDDETVVGLQDNGTKLEKDGTWRDVLGGDGMNCVIDYTDNNIQYGSLYYGNIYRTTDEWQNDISYITGNIPGGAAGNWVTPFALDPINHNVLYVGFNKLWKSEDMGNHFEELNSFPSALDFISICPTNSDYIYVGTENFIYKTSDGGKTWVNITSGLPSDSPFSDIEVKYNDPNTVWVTLGEFDTNAVYVSYDGGGSWFNISDGLPEIPVLNIIQNRLESSFDQLYIGTAFGVFKKNGDSAWVRYSNRLPNVVVTDLDIYYDYENPENSRLRASTYGRGLWETPLQLSGNFAPLVTTIGVENVSYSSAEISGNITNDFGSQISQSGVLLSENSQPFINDTDVIVIYTEPVVTEGQFSLTVENLKDGTTYYYRAFATNANGTGYGTVKNFATNCYKVDTFPWFDDCEYRIFPNCYYQSPVQEEAYWKLMNGNGQGNPDTAYSGQTNFFFGNVNIGHPITKLVLPKFDFSDFGSAELSFFMYNAPTFNLNDQLFLYYRTSEADSWHLFASVDSGFTRWNYFSFDLPELSDSYEIAFEGIINGGKGVCIDDISIDAATAVGNDKNFVFGIYPNPFDNKLIININDNAKMILTDFTGKIILRSPLHKGANDLDLGFLQPGIYLLRIENSTGTYSEKIIKHFRR